LNVFYNYAYQRPDMTSLYLEADVSMLVVDIEVGRIKAEAEGGR